MNTEIHDIKPPLDIPSPLLWLWFLLGLIIIGVILFFLWLWFKKRPQVSKLEPSLPSIPAWQKAYDRLENLRFQKLMERADLKPFYIELSNIIRHYLEEQFSIRAPEMTTEEFLESLKNSNVLNDAQKITLKEFLFTCDMVKFAKMKPSLSEAEQSFALAKQLIDQTHGI